MRFLQSTISEPVHVLMQNAKATIGTLVVISLKTLENPA
jgi:small nuclear ribonucleoprotein (snRNP)-like protein